MSEASSPQIAAPKIGEEVVYLERGSYAGPTRYKAQVVAVHSRPFTPPALDLVCVDGRGRSFARTRVPHESVPGESVAWRHVT